MRAFVVRDAICDGAVIAHRETNRAAARHEKLIYLIEKKFLFFFIFYLHRFR